MLGSVLGLSFTASTLNERLWKPGVNGGDCGGVGEGGAPVKAITIVPAGPETPLETAWPWPVPLGISAANKISMGTSSAIAARQDNRCFTREACNRDFGSRLG